MHSAQPVWARASKLRALLALAAAGLTMSLAAGSASALVVHLPDGHSISVSPLAGALTPVTFASPATRTAKKSRVRELEYHGGPIMPSNTNYAFYWDPSGAPAYPAEYQSGIDRYFEDLAHDSGGDQNVDSVAAQYDDSAGEYANYDSHFAGQIVDTDPYPANGCTAATICLTDGQLQAELSAYIKAHSLPHDLMHEYFMLTPPGVESCAEAASTECSAGSSFPDYCAYHSYIATAGGSIVYADDPYVTGIEGCDDGEHPNDKPSDGALQGGLTHEHNESITDPEIDAWYDSRGEEIGDKCRTFVEASEYGPPLGRAPDGSRYNQVIDGDLYWYQQEWSNEASECRQRRSASAVAPTVSRISPKRGPGSGGTTVTITGSGFTGVTAVMFGSSAAASYTVLSSTTISAVSPAEPKGSVYVTVTASGGTNATSRKDRFKFS